MDECEIFLVKKDQKINFINRYKIICSLELLKQFIIEYNNNSTITINILIDLNYIEIIE